MPSKDREVFCVTLLEVHLQSIRGAQMKALPVIGPEFSPLLQHATTGSLQDPVSLQDPGSSLMGSYCSSHLHVMTKRADAPCPSPGLHVTSWMRCIQPHRPGAPPCRAQLACWLGAVVLLEYLPHSPSFLESSRAGVWYLLERWSTAGDMWDSRYRLDQQQTPPVLTDDGKAYNQQVSQVPP